MPAKRRSEPGTHIYWTTNGDAGYPIEEHRADGLRCPHCVVLFALDDDDSILAVIHELDCPAGGP